MKQPPSRTTVNLRELRENLSSYLRRVRQGTVLTVTSRGIPVARIMPPLTETHDRAALIGMFKTGFYMAPDFDETPDELIAAMEGDV